MSKRSSIVSALVDLFNDNLDGTTYTSNIYKNAKNKLVFWDEINEYPFIGVTAGAETRQYLPSNFKWGFLTITIKIILEEENSAGALEQFIEDIEALIDANNNLQYNEAGESTKTTELISILSIDTDQGLLDPQAVGEIVLEVQYDL